MCLDISFRIDEAEDSIFDYLPNLKKDPQLDLNLDLRPHIMAMDRPLTKVIYMNNSNEPYETLMRWGIVTGYMLRDYNNFLKYHQTMYNVRAERLLEPGSVWLSLRKQRCLIDTEGIYEHRHIVGWKNHVPYFIRLKNKKRWLIPALYNYVSIGKDELEQAKRINDKDFNLMINKLANFETGETKMTYGMLTQPANAVMKNIHNHGNNKHRMPVFMQPEQAVKWLDPNLTDADLQKFLDYEIPSEDLEYWPVYTIRLKGNNSRKDGLPAHAPYDWPGLPPLGIDNAQLGLF